MRGMGRLYTCQSAVVSITAQQDLLYFKPAAEKPILVEHFEIIAAGGTADAGDAQEELWDIEAIDVPTTVTVGSGGSSVTPRPQMPSDTAAGFTCRANDTTKATSSGTIVPVWPTGMNNRIGLPVTPIPEHGLWVSSTAALVIRLNTTPADAILVSVLAKVREFG